MSPTKIYLITGANRGLGKGLVESLVKRPDTTVIAGVRNPTDTASKSLGSVSTGSGSKIITVAIDSNDETSAKKAVETLQAQYGIDKIDVVIANAGISKYYGSAEITPISEVREHFEVNTIGVILLFQATAPLLKRSSAPVFVGISTGVASIGDMGTLPLPSAAYGISKVALNYFVQKVHYENPDITAFVLSPGWVQTEMGNHGAKSNGMEEAPVTLKESVDGMLSKFDRATKENMSGTFQSFDATQYAW